MPHLKELYFDNAEDAQHAADVLGAEVEHLGKNWSRESGIYGLDPYTYRLDVTPLTHRVRVSAERLAKAREDGHSFNQLLGG